jgi:hypothetical protein
MLWFRLCFCTFGQNVQSFGIYCISDFWRVIHLCPCICRFSQLLQDTDLALLLFPLTGLVNSLLGFTDWKECLFLCPCFLKLLTASTFWLSPWRTRFIANDILLFLNGSFLTGLVYSIFKLFELICHITASRCNVACQFEQCSFRLYSWFVTCLSINIATNNYVEIKI